MKTTKHNINFCVIIDWKECNKECLKSKSLASVELQVCTRHCIQMKSSLKQVYKYSKTVTLSEYNANMTRQIHQHCVTCKPLLVCN